jgi:hypothetical protein
MTFDPRWLNQIPLFSVNGGDVNSLVSLAGSAGLDVADWAQSVALGNLAVNGDQALATAKLRSGNMLVAYADTDYKVAVVNPSGSVVVSAVTIGAAATGNYLKAATLANGNVVIAFYEAATPRIRFIIYDERLNVVTVSTVVAGTGGFTEFSVTPLADGNFVIGYSNGSSKNAFQIFDQDGDVVRTEVIISSANVDRNEVVGLQDGNFMVFITNSTSAWYYIYDRQGTQVLGATSLGVLGTLVDYPTTLLSNGHVVYAYNDSNDLGVGIIDPDGNEIVASTIVATTTKTGGSLFALPNNTYGFAYRNSAGTAAYFQIRDNLNVSVKAETQFGGTWTTLASLTAGVFSSGEFLFLGVDTDVKRTIWAGSKAAFAKDLQVLEDFSLASGVSVNAISNSTLSSSATTLPTSYAVKDYVDNQIGGVPRYIIDEGNSKVEVQDSTSEATQYVTIQINDTEMGRFEDLGTTKIVRIGPSGDTRIDLDTNTNVVSVKSATTEVLNLGLLTQSLGVSADTIITIDQSTNLITFKSANVTVGQFDSNGLTLSAGSAINEFSTDNTLGGYNGGVGSDTVVASEKAVRSYIDDIHYSMRDPNGIEQRNDSTISFDSTSRVFSIVPVGDSFDIFIRGQRYVIDSSTSVEITDVEGLHYIYFNDNGILTHSTTWSNDYIFTVPYVSVIYWDATNNKAIYVGDERHGIIMDGATHWNLHNSRGTVYLDGLGIGDLVTDGTGSLDVEAQLSVSAGTIFDEDITTSIPTKSAPANIPIFYRSGAGAGNWRSSTANNFPLITTGSGRMAWNELSGGSWQLTEATDNYYVYVHYFATNDYDNSRKIIGILGQTQYSDLTTAQEQANQINEMVLQGVPFAEFVAIGSVLYQTSNSFTNSVKTSARPAQGGDYADWRYAKISSVPGQVTDHGSLSGLADDDHLQYARLTGLRPFTGLTTFNAGVTVAGGSLTLDNGVPVNDISNDTTLVDDSSASVPTEHAVKVYVDTQIANLNPDKIWADDSKVEVVDDGTATGYVQIVTDGVQVAYFDVLSSTQRIGKAAESRLLVGDDLIELYAGATPASVARFGFDQSIGVSGNVVLEVNQGDGALNVWVNSTIQGYWTDGVQVIGRDSDTRIYLSGLTDVIDFHIGSGYGMQLTSNGLQMAQGGTLGGAIINEFTNDPSLTGDSTTALVTEHAVKDYVDTQISGMAPNRIWQLNSEVVVTDTGTDGAVSIKADGLEVGLFTDNGVTLGDITSVNFKADLDDTELFFNTPSQKGSVTSNRVWFGDNGTNAGIDIHTQDQTVDIYAGDSPDTVKIALDSTSASLFINSIDIVFYATSNTFGIGNPNAAPGTAFLYGNTAGIHIHDVDSTDQIALFDSTGVQLATGAKINEFSTDDTLGDVTPSDNIVPTQAAVKAYVDSQIGGQANRIWEGDSEVRVTDAGTGSIVTKADNTDVQSLTLNTQRIGQSASSRVELVVSPAPTVDLYAGTTNVFSGSLTAVTVGMTADTRMNINNVADIISFSAGNINVAQLSLTTLRIGQAADSRLVLDTTNDLADLYAGTTQIIDGATTTQIFGVAGDSNLFFDQANDYADLYAGVNRIVRGELNLQVFGVAGDSRLETDQTNDTIDLYAGTVKVVNGTTNVLTLGVSGDTYFTINQTDDQINAYTGNTLQMQVENTGVSVEGDLTVRGNLSIDGTAFIVFNEEVKTEDNIITVNYGDPGPGVTRGIAGLEVDRGSSPIYQFIFQESTDTFRVGETGQTQAVATREDDPDGYKVAWWNDDNRRFETLGDEYIKVDQTSNNIIFVTGLAQRGQFDSDGLTLQLGTSVNEFSTDVTLAGDSDDAVPTEKAVKTYVDSQIGGQANLIWQDDSKVEVIDDGTDAGVITVTADNVAVSTFNATTQTIGQATESRLEVTNNLVTVYGGATPADVLSLGSSQRVGLSSDSRLELATGTADLYAGTTQIIDGATTTQIFGVAGDSSLVLDQSTNTADLYAGATRVFAGAVATQVVGVSGDTLITLAQGANTITMTAGASDIFTGGTTAQTLGISTDSRIVVDQAGNSIACYAGTTQLLLLGDTSQTLGKGDDTFITLLQGSNQISLNSGNISVGNFTDTAQTIGLAADSRLFLDASNDLADLYAGTTQIIDGATTSQTFGVSGDSRLDLDQTADTAKLYAGSTLVFDGGVNLITIGTAADTNISIDQTGSIIFEANNTAYATVNTSGLTLQTGASIVEFSIDGTLVGNSDTAVPTEQAVKTYVDTEINDLRQELDLINVRNVYADTTASTGDVILADTTAGDVTIQLLESTDGKIIIKKKSTDGNKVYITTTPGMIDGQSQIIIDTGYQAYTFVCDGTNFFII